MGNNYPGSLNTGSSLVNNRNTGDSIPASDHNDLVSAQIAVEAKLGTGAGAPTTAGYVLTSLGSSQSAWQPAGGGSGQITFFNVKAYGAVGNGSNDDTSAIQAAISAALATSRGTGAVYFPAGSYKITATLNCSSATSGSAGKGVFLVGDGREASQILKSSNFIGVEWKGYQGPTYPNQFGGLRDITVNGNGMTGAAVHVTGGQQMEFSGASIIGNSDVSLDLDTCQDSYFYDLTFNNCGSTTKRVIEIYGSVSGTTNMLWFSQIRVETFLKGAVAITRGSGATGGGNNGFFFSQCKFENYPTVAGDMFFADSYTQQLIMDKIFLSFGLFNSGYSTPANGITFGDGGTSPGFNQASFRDIFMNTGPTSLIGNAVININGGSHLSGTIMLDNVYGDSTLSTAQVVINGASGTTIGVGLIGGPGTIVGGDGSGTRSVLGAQPVPVVKGGTAATNLTSGNTTGSLATAVTSSITPTGNNLVLLTVGIRNGTVQPTTPTVTGNGLTWVAVAHSDFKVSGSRRTVYLFRALGASPSAGAVTITFGETETDAAWVIDQISGVVTTGTNGSGAVKQNATLADTSGTATALAPLLTYFDTYRNGTYSAFGTDGVDTPSAGANFAVTAHSGNGSIEATGQFSALASLSAPITYGGAAFLGGIAIEVVSA